jgi:nicotinate-nucleotide adenylyltransferase
MDSAERIARIDSFVKACLSANRYAHSKSTAELVRRLCARFGEDGDAGYIAGLAHDAARELPPGEMVRLCARDALPVSGSECRDPILLHGRAAAALVLQRTGCGDTEVLRAIRDHVTGRPSMGAIAKMVFCADFLEPERGYLKAGLRERMLSLGLDAMTLAVLRSKMQYVRSIGKTLSPSSKALLKELMENAG